MFFRRPYGIKIWTDLSTILSQFTRVTDRRTDGRTDGQTEFSSQYRVCITCSAVKIVPDMTYNVFGATLNLAQSIAQAPTVF